MTRTIDGAENHKKLGDYAVSILKKRGIKNIMFETKIGEGCRIDILAIDKKNKKIGIECFVVPQLKKVEEKIKKYKNYLDKLIFAVPTNYKNKVKQIKGLDEVFCIDIPIKTIKIKENTHKKLEDVGKKGETFDDIINRILDEKSVQNGAKKQ